MAVSCVLEFNNVVDVVEYIRQYKKKNNGVGPRLTAKSNNGQIIYRTKIW